MNIETTNLHGWENTIRLANDSVELFVTTDVGPRILVYKTRQGEQRPEDFRGSDQLGR